MPVPADSVAARDDEADPGLVIRGREGREVVFRCQRGLPLAQGAGCFRSGTADPCHQPAESVARVSSTARCIRRRLTLEAVRVPSPWRWADFFKSMSYSDLRIFVESSGSPLTIGVRRRYCGLVVAGHG